MAVTRRLNRRLALLLAIAVIAPASVVSQTPPAKRGITHESMWLMKRVGAPIPSPDGRWVIFSVTDPAYDDKDQVTDLWIASTDGKTSPRRLTSTKGGESGSDWSPDSHRIAFSARREGDEASWLCH
jgi:Tol biopolymer transport system component